jgi:hypothetical protein
MKTKTEKALAAGYLLSVYAVSWFVFPTLALWITVALALFGAWFAFLILVGANLN